MGLPVVAFVFDENVPLPDQALHEITESTSIETMCRFVEDQLKLRAQEEGQGKQAVEGSFENPQLRIDHAKAG